MRNEGMAVFVFYSVQCVSWDEYTPQLDAFY